MNKEIVVLVEAKDGIKLNICADDSVVARSNELDIWRIDFCGQRWLYPGTDASGVYSVRGIVELKPPLVLPGKYASPLRIKLEISRVRKNTFKFIASLLEDEKLLGSTSTVRKIDYNSGYEDLKFFINKEKC